jgi:hypothetical protein
MRNPYECLAVPRTATAEEISKSFRHLAKQLHPDVNNDPKAAALFAELSAAHGILSDDKKRRAFDRGEIDAEGRLRFPPGRPRSRTWRSVPLAAAALMLVAISTLIVQRLGSALFHPEDNEQRATGTLMTKPAGAPFQPRLVLQQTDSYARDNTIPLGLQVSGETAGLTLDVAGLPIGTTLSSGQPIEGGKWRVPATDVGKVMLRPPAGFSGALDFAVELHLADETVIDSGSFRLEWTPAAAPPLKAAGDGIVTDTPSDQGTAGLALPQENSPQRVAQLDGEQTELLIARSQEMMRQGDFEAARTLLLGAAERHDARAALALGATFDPILLAAAQTRGIAADISLARYWYEKASEFGSRDAQQRLQLLASPGIDGGPIAVGQAPISRSVKPGPVAKDVTSEQAKHKPALARQPSNEPRSPALQNDASGVYVAGERVGADPDPNIRAQLLRDDASRQLHTDSSGRQLLADPAKPTANGR